MPRIVTAAIKHILMNPSLFSEKILQLPLRHYQLEAQGAIIDNILNQRGDTITVMMSRQSGKNEMAAHTQCYLLNLFQRRRARMVATAPTYKPQLINAMLRLDELLDNPWNRHQWRRSQGYIYHIGQAQLAFLSGAPGSSVVGATANLLLMADEAQDLDPEKWDKEFRPMASTANATCLMTGTAWISDTLLATQIEENKRLEKKDGIRRHFEYNWEVLAELSPQYKAFCLAERARLGADDITWLTQFQIRTVDAISRLFPDHVIAALNSLAARGDHVLSGPIVAGLDPAGEATDRHDTQEHDRAALLLGQAGISQAGDPLCHVSEMFSWQGEKHHVLIPQVCQILDNAQVDKVAIDTTGLGEVWASSIEHALGAHRVIRYPYTRPSKSALAYDLIAFSTSGRLSVYGSPFANRPRKPPQPAQATPEQLFWYQMSKCRRTALPGRLLSFEVPESDGHDDFPNALALICHAARQAGPQQHAAAEPALPVIEKETF